MVITHSSPLMQPAHSKRPYHPALDGLRGLGILLVVVYHNFGFINYSSFGWLGVDLFFVLSGFLITDILLKTLGTKDYLRNFYMRRVLRIFPLYYLSLVIFLFILPGFNLLPDSDYYVDNQAWLWTYLQNWLFIFKGNDTTVSLHHLWSLAVEEQFYLIWPLLILLFRKPRSLLVLLILLLAAVMVLRWWIWINDVSELSYYRLYTFTRIDGLCIGCLVAVIRKMDLNFLKKYTFVIVLFFAALNFAFFFINRGQEFSFPYLALVGYTTFAVLFGLLVNEAVSGDTLLINQVFSFRPLRFLGRISYGLYIFHWPLYLVLKGWLEPILPAELPVLSTSVVVSMIATIAAIGISWLSFRYYEQYFLKLKVKFA